MGIRGAVVPAGGVLVYGWATNRGGGSGEPAPFLENSNSQLQLQNKLKELRTEYTRMDTIFASNIHRPLAGTLDSIFESVEWRINPTNVALDTYRNELISGVEVKGTSQFLVEQVADAMQDAGVAALKSIVVKPGVELTGSKRLHDQGAIKITIGHH